MTDKYEAVTIQVPKPIMAFLRLQTEMLNFSTVENLIEYDLLDEVRAEMEGMNGEELIAALGLGPIFYNGLGDERYAPKEPEPKAEPVTA